MALLLAACSTPKHTNVLIFGTNTKFAFDIGYDPKTQEPSLTVGYKRQEAVWLPLLANTGDDGEEPGKSEYSHSIGNSKEEFKGTGPLYRGNESINFDTYSVLASFGASWGGKGNGTNGAESSGGIAQYFATGLAARKLADKGGAELVSVQSPARSEVLELKQAREEEFTEAARQKRVDAQLGMIDALTDEQAINLEKNPPVKDDAVEKMVDLMDPLKKRSTVGSAAKKTLKFRNVMSGKRSDAELDAWEAALKSK